MKKKNKEENDPKREEKKLMKHFVEIGIPMLDLLYGHLRQANVRIEPDSSIFDGPAGAYITTDLINALAAEWIKSEKEKNKKVFVSLDDIELEITSWKDYVDRCILRTGEKPIISKVDIFDIPRMSKNYDDKILIDTMKKYMEDSEKVVNSPAFKSLKDGVAKLIHDSVIGVSVFAKIIDPEDKKPYKEKIEFKEEGSWMRDDILGTVFCVKGIDRDCYIDVFDMRHPPLVCTYIGKPKYSKGDMLFLVRSGQKFIVKNVALMTDGEFVYEGIAANGDVLLANESLCAQYIPKPAVIGKPAIFWDYDKITAFVAILSEVKYDKYYPFGIDKDYWHNAILLESLEQYELFVKQ